MIEAYVESVMDYVETICKEQGVSEGYFWDWLGNQRFKADNGNLTPERAEQIKRDIALLFKEYKEMAKLK